MHPSLFPFSNPKQIALAKVDIEKLHARALSEVEQIIQELNDLTNEAFKLTIAKRKTGQAMLYYWRFRGTSDRSFYRYSADPIQAYCKHLGHDMHIQFTRIEAVLLQVNATLKYCAAITNVISDYSDYLNTDNS